MDVNPANATIPPELNNPLWQYALTLWSDPAIEQVCLALQERGWSVTRILCACWLSSLGRRYEREPELVSRWRQQVTQPLRSLRQSLCKDDTTVANLRNRVASAELEAERIELAVAYSELQADSEATDTVPDAVIWSNLHTAAPNHDIDADARELMTVLIQLLPPQAADNAEGTAPCAG